LDRPTAVLSHTFLLVPSSSSQDIATRYLLKSSGKDTSKKTTTAGSKNNYSLSSSAASAGTLEIRPSPSRAKAAAIRRNPRLTRDVDSRQIFAKIEWNSRQILL
jgi:hypothetical protein